MAVLANKVALVTGAGQGIGRGIALAFAKEGAAVAVVGRTLDKLVQTCADIETAGGRAKPFVCDVKDSGQIAETVAAVASAFGRIDVLVNNAQEITFGPVIGTPDAEFEAMFTSGPLAVLRFMRECHPHLKASGAGAVINLASPIAFVANAGYGVYAAAKEAIRALTRTAAYEWGVDGVTVNAIAPIAASPNYETWAVANPEGARGLIATIPLGRVGDCEADIGRAVVFLAGPDARYITGATIPLDGGQANFG
ncbi:MAG TPA: SDR family oxidoreductase [Stellaceae bacterium]|nr:SDR family oxidoreductase [Stellaceae bacterium]